VEDRRLRYVFALIVIALALPELPRYRGERRLNGLTGMTRVVMERKDLVRYRIPALRRISVEAERTRTHPGDWRPLVAAGNASLLSNDMARAVELFERANALGERPEIDVSLAVALERMGDHARAAQLRARAARIAPAFRAAPPPGRSQSRRRDAAPSAQP